MRIKNKLILSFLVLWCIGSPIVETWASEDDIDVKMKSCLGELAFSSAMNMTAGEMRELCHKKIGLSVSVAEDVRDEEDPVDRRMRADVGNILRPFTIMSHKPTYFLFSAHNFAGYSEEEYRRAFEDEEIEVDNTETQFQISIKTPLAVDIFNSKVDIFAAYTVRSFWQLYNTEHSSPFRETNHEPEIWLQRASDLEFFGFKNVANFFGIVHQSNGQAGTLSRSWNRIFANFIFQKGNFVFSIKPWYRISEDREDDDNPDITDYLGHGEWGMAYKHNDHVFSMMSRNNIESGFSRGTVELGWSFPLFDYPYLKGYVNYFSGYGESLIDYDKYVNRLGLGILLTDFL